MERFDYRVNDCACPNADNAVINLDSKVGLADDCACPVNSKAIVSEPDCACPNVVSSKSVFQEDCATPSMVQIESPDRELGNFLTMSKTFPGLAVIIHLAN